MHATAKFSCFAKMQRPSHSMTGACVVCGGITEMHACANLRKALATPISKMANITAEMCGKGAYIENGEVNSKCEGMNGFVLSVIFYVYWTCETLYFYVI